MVAQEVKAKLDAKVEAVKFRATQDRSRRRSRRRREEKKAKINALNVRIAKASGDAEVKMEARPAERHAERTEHVRRSKLLHEA